MSTAINSESIAEILSPLLLPPAIRSFTVPRSINNNNNMQCYSRLWYNVYVESRVTYLHITLSSRRYFRALKKTKSHRRNSLTAYLGCVIRSLRRMESLRSNERVGLVLLVPLDAQHDCCNFIRLVGVYYPLVSCLNSKTSIQ